MHAEPMQLSSGLGKVTLSSTPTFTTTSIWRGKHVSHFGLLQRILQGSPASSRRACFPPRNRLSLKTGHFLPKICHLINQLRTICLTMPSLPGFSAAPVHLHLLLAQGKSSHQNQHPSFQQGGFPATAPSPGRATRHSGGRHIPTCLSSIRTLSALARRASFIECFSSLPRTTFSPLYLPTPLCQLGRRSCSTIFVCHCVFQLTRTRGDTSLPFDVFLLLAALMEWSGPTIQAITETMPTSRLLFSDQYTPFRVPVIAMARKRILQDCAQAARPVAALDAISAIPAARGGIECFPLRPRQSLCTATSGRISRDSTQSALTWSPQIIERGGRLGQFSQVFVHMNWTATWTWFEWVCSTTCLMM
ncbi:hypothetical protein BCR44DRAFT_238395 [Catenaria anguillulae PL171]|uniref:Uncharacterized protein n=1 Tax=Catenaria anguillulae PL171 TaxID=765915 RepID=A0A1Y2HEU4_9FUNG|nr:hypothetical protein BCR44DRAFT_238395 [Catenaria anguillulae PL171]